MNQNALVTQADAVSREVSAFGSASGFDTAQRVAKGLAASTIVPKDYQQNLPNVLVAMEYANRLGASVLAVMQNLDIIHGRPSLRATFLIGTVNASGRFSPIRYRMQGEEGEDSWGCRAWAKDKASGEECVGPLVTIGLAKKEGWYAKNGSKWQTIPELMLRYRAAAWWTRLFSPELSLGLHTTDEVEDFGIDVRGRVEEAAAALDAPEPETIPGVPVEDDTATASQLAQLEELREKARTADVMTVELEQDVEEALRLKVGSVVRSVIRDVSLALIPKDGDQAELPVEG